MLARISTEERMMHGMMHGMVEGTTYHGFLCLLGEKHGR